MSTDIRALKVMNMCLVLSTHLTANKNYGQNTVVTVYVEVANNTELAETII